MARVKRSRDFGATFLAARGRIAASDKVESDARALRPTVAEQQKETGANPRVGFVRKTNRAQTVAPGERFQLLLAFVVRRAI